MSVLRSCVEEIAKVERRCYPAGLVRYTKSELLLQYGIVMPFNATSFKGRRMKAHACYQNAGKLALYEGYTYCEGYILQFGAIPIEHAWVLDRNGKVLDRTVRNKESIGEYYGITFSREYLIKVLTRSKVWGILDPMYNRPLFNGTDNPEDMLFKR